MTPDNKPTWRSRIFGAAYERDERVKSAADRAGHYSFSLLMVILFACMAAGLLIKRPDLYLMAGLFFLSGCLIYLFFLVKTSAFSTDPGSKGVKKYYLFAIGAALFAAVDIGLNYLSFDGGTASSFLSLAIQGLIKALLWIGLFVLLSKVLITLSHRRIDKKINKD
jgi:hypothetical protein